MRHPHPAPGQTLMFCPTCRRFTLWDFTPDDRLRCTGCTREEERE